MGSASGTARLARRPAALTSGESGFAEAYRVHRPGLVKLAAFIVGDQATGEDVVQDVFARLHQRWDMLADRVTRCLTCGRRWSTAAARRSSGAAELSGTPAM